MASNMEKIIKKIIRYSYALIFILGTAFLPGCGGGTRGTGDLTIEGKILKSTGAPVNGVSVTFTKTGDVANTDNNGNFLLRTKSVDGQTEFLIESDNIQLFSQGVMISRDVENIVVTITISNFDSAEPTASQDVSIKRRRNDNNTIGNQQDEDNKGKDDESDDDKSAQGTNNEGGTPDSGGPGKGVNSDADNDHDSRSNDGDTSSSDSDQNSSSNTNSDNDNQHLSDDDRHDENTPSPTNTPGEDIKVERKGIVTSISSNEITVGGTTFTVNDATEFKDFSSLSQIKTGDNVEIKGYKHATAIFAEEIKKL